MQGEIFQEFYQIGNVARDRRRGLGLGLAIVARLARLLSTKLTSARRLVAAPCFRCAYRVGEDRLLPEPARTRNPWRNRSAAMPAILVVDDDPLVLAGNQALLTELGCQVTTVSDGRGAGRRWSHSGSTVIVLCDLWLSDELSGIDVLRRLATLTTRPFRVS